jgi:protoheme IX farnesyltransferase
MKSDFILLSKPKMVFVFMAMGLASYLIEGGKSPAQIIALFAVGFMAPSSTNLITSAIDMDIDKLMRRTRKRPLPSGRVEKKSALGAGVFLGLLSLVIAWKALGTQAGLIVFGAIIGVAFVYNLLLKRRTAFATLVGAVPGSAPVLVGGTAARGELTIEIILLAGILFLWQLPHFWIISLKHQSDYVKAAVPIIASVYGERAVRVLIFASTVLLLTYTLSFGARFGPLFFTSTLFAGGLMTVAAIEIVRGLNPVPNHIRAYILFILVVFISASVS